MPITTTFAIRAASAGMILLAGGGYLAQSALRPDPAARPAPPVAADNAAALLPPVTEEAVPEAAIAPESEIAPEEGAMPPDTDTAAAGPAPAAGPEISPDTPPMAPRAPELAMNAGVRLPGDPPADPAPASPAVGPAALALADTGPDAAPLRDRPIQIAVAADDPPVAPIAPQPQAEVLSDAAPAVSALGLPCGLTVTATAQPAAMVAIDVMDPCQPGARVVIEHGALTMAARTDALGLLTVDVPAFETPAFFTVRMPDGGMETLLAAVPDLSEHNRVGVAWSGDEALELHAMEFGAAFGDEGHVWLGAPRNPREAMEGAGGFLTVLGDPDFDVPVMAQVYTLPRAALRDGDSVQMSIDAPVTETNCGDPAEALAFWPGANGQVEVTDISFTFPGCEAVGDFLLLQNFLSDVRLASN